MKKDWLTKYSDKLESAVKRSDWKEVNKITKEMNKELKPYKWYNRGSKQFEINGQKFSKAELEGLMSDFQKNIGKDIEGLTVLKAETMAGVARTSKYKADVQDYGFSTKWYGSPVNWAYKKWDKGIGKRDLFFGAMTLSAPVYALDPVLRNSYMTYNNLAIVADPCYEKPQGEIMAAEEVQAADQQFAQARAQIDAARKNIDKQIDSLG